ncbi:MAG: hypothetical protein LBP22_07780 [Deltaproteobacteria bacterium]|jgi:hypothetical protein|nr:hypothetical protein [Deltaproteobacteria bacterium]
MTLISTNMLLYLWNLAGHGGGGWLKDLDAELAIKTNERRFLGLQGLLTETPRLPRIRPNKRKTTGTWLVLTEEGWQHLGRNINDPLVTKVQKASQILSRLLKRLSVFLDQKSLSPADLFRAVPDSDHFGILSHQPAGKKKPEEKAASPYPSSGQAKENTPAPDSHRPPDEKKPEDPTPEAILVRLKDIPVSSAEPGGGFKLAVVRKELSDISRECLDKALEILQKENRLVLFETVDPLAISPQDRAAAVELAGLYFHTVFLRS